MAKYTLMKNRPCRACPVSETVHGTIQTPVFMNVGTVEPSRAQYPLMDLKETTQVELPIPIISM